MAKPFSPSLSISTGYAPFELSRDERLMGHEDWAWRFLRLNPRYRTSYATAATWQRGNPDIRLGAAPFPDSRPERVHYYGEDFCRRKFGISTWLDPANVDLPPLEKGESWFAPLKSVIARPESISGLETNEGLFGYPTWVKRPDHKIELNGSRNAGIWFLIDCSVPLDAQFSSVEILCDRFASQIRSAGFTGSDFDLKDDPIVETIDASPTYSAHDFLLAHSASDQLEDDDDAWRLLRIDVLGRTLGQIKEGRKLLNLIHDRLIDDGVVTAPKHRRLWTNLAGSQGRGSGKPSDGNRLKCYVILAECQLEGIESPENIIDFLTERGAGSLVGSMLSEEMNHWLQRDVRVKRFGQRMDEVPEYIERGYKWLIHSQNPPISTP